MEEYLEKDFSGEAVSLLTPKFKDKNFAVGFVTAATQYGYEVQENIRDLLKANNVKEAVGEGLDFFGSILDIPRLGLDDTEYRKLILNRIIVNSSKGTINSFIEMMRIILPEDVTFTVEENFPAGVTVIIYGVQNVINESVVRDLLPIGVGGIFFANPYVGKDVWFVQEVLPDGSVFEDEAGVLPEVEDIETSNKVLVDIFYIT